MYVRLHDYIFFMKYGKLEKCLCQQNIVALKPSIEFHHKNVSLHEGCLMCTIIVIRIHGEKSCIINI